MLGFLTRLVCNFLLFLSPVLLFALQLQFHLPSTPVPITYSPATWFKISDNAGDGVERLDPARGVLVSVQLLAQHLQESVLNQSCLVLRLGHSRAFHNYILYICIKYTYTFLYQLLIIMKILRKLILKK